MSRLSQAICGLGRIFLLLILLLSPGILAIDKEGVIRFVWGNLFDPKMGEPSGVELHSNGNMYPTYLAVVAWHGRWVCGKYVPGLVNRGYFDLGYTDGKEIELPPNKFRVLEAPPGTLRWVKTGHYTGDLQTKAWFNCGVLQPGLVKHDDQTRVCRYRDDNGNLITGTQLVTNSIKTFAYTFGGRVHQSDRTKDLEYPMWTNYGKVLLSANKQGWANQYPLE